MSKIELLHELNRFTIEHSEDSLPDDFSFRNPGSLSDGIGRFMVKQIEWVNGGEPRLTRAAVARWRARNQRDAWIKMDVALASLVDKFDARLKEFWSDRFGPMCHDCKDHDEAALRANGLALLDWSHLTAHTEIPPIRKLWEQPYLVQGTYQQLAEEGGVGWHPNYIALLEALQEAE